MFLGMGAPELIVILLVALVLFGPKNLPKLGTALGQTVKNVREGMEGADEPSGRKEAETSEAAASQDATSDADAGADDGAASADDSAAGAEPARTRACPECGAMNEQEAAFCSRCGARLA